MSNHFTDTIPLPQRDGLSTTLTVGCALMKDTRPVSPIRPDGDLRVVRDAAGHPLVFTLGADSRLRLFQFTNGEQSGYTETDLTASFGADARALAFDVAEDRAGRISLAVALGQGVIQLARGLAPADTDWSALATHARPLTGIGDGFRVDALQLDARVVVASGSLDGREVYFEAIDGTEASQMALPEDTQELTQLALGAMLGQPTRFFLYPEGHSQTLTAITADGPLGRSVYDFSPGATGMPEPFRSSRYTCMQVAPGRDQEASDLYVGTNKGLVLFRGGRISNGGFQVVSDLADVRQLYVTEDDQDISLWAMTSGDQIWYIRGRKGETLTWSPAVLFHRDAVHIAPIRSPHRRSNELYLVTSSLDLLHLWQAPESTLWRERRIDVEAETELISEPSYQCSLRFAARGAQPTDDATVSLTASEWVFAIVNERVYSIDPDTPAEVPLDATGRLTVLLPASDIAPPILHVTGGPLGRSVANIYPNGGIVAGLQPIQSGQDLQQATDQQGNRVLPADAPEGEVLDGVATQLGSLNQAGRGFKPGPHRFVALTDGERHSGRTRPAPVAADLHVGLRLERGVWRPVNGIPAASVTDAAGELFGDVLRWVEHAIDEHIAQINRGIVQVADGVTVVLKTVAGALHLDLHLVGRVLSVAIDTFAKVFKVADWLLCLVGIDLMAILRWLGLLFGWNDVWKTHKTIAKLLGHGIDAALAHADRARAALESFLSTSVDALQQQLAGPLPDLQGHSDSADNPLDSLQGNWLLGKLMHASAFAGGVSGDRPAGLQQVQEAFAPVTAALMDQLDGLEEALSGDTGALWKNLQHLVGALLEAVQRVVRILLDDLVGVLESLKKSLEKTLELPFLSSLYRWVSRLPGVHIEPPTLRNIVALVVAIPLTARWKEDHHGAPLHGDHDELAESGLFDELAGSVRATPMAARAAAASSSLDRYRRVGAAIGASADALAAPLASLALSKVKDPLDGALTNVARWLAPALVLLKSVSTVPVAPSASVGYGFKLSSWLLSGVVNLSMTSWRLRSLDRASKQLSFEVQSGSSVLVVVLVMIGDSELGVEPAIYAADVLNGLGKILLFGGLAEDDPYRFGAGLAGVETSSIVTLARVFS